MMNVRKILLLVSALVGCATPGHRYGVISRGDVGTVSTVTSTDGTVTVTNPTGPTVNVAVPPASVASWANGALRFFAVDTTNGNDANLGYSDVSQTAAGAVAVKTLGRMMQMLPRFGQGRAARVAIASGSYASDTQWTIDGASGLTSGVTFNSLIFIGTGTNATAGATAFAGDTNDSLDAGFVNATGMNATGYNVTAYTVDADGTPHVTLQLNGGGAPAWTANGTARPYGCRVRFDVATATAGLHNQMDTVIYVSGSNQLILSSALPAAPAIGDVLYIEMPGVTGMAQTLITNTGESSTAVFPTSFSGIQFGNLDVSRSSVVIGQSETLNTQVSQSFVSLTDTISDTSATGFTNPLRSGVRLSRITQTGGVFKGVAMTTTTTSSPSPVWLSMSSVTWERSASASGIQKIGGGIGGNAVAETVGTNGSSAHGATCQVFGTSAVGGGAVRAGFFIAASVTHGRINYINMGANPALHLAGPNLGVVFAAPFATPTGSTGNTDVGLDLTAFSGSGTAFGAAGAQIAVSQAPTVTGTAGDVRLANGTIVSWATAMSGVIDTNNNQIFGVASGPSHVIAVPNGSTATTFTGVGPAAASTTIQRWVQFPDNAGGYYLVPSYHVTEPGTFGLLSLPWADEPSAYVNQ